MSVRICASTTASPAEGGPANRLYDTLGSFSLITAALGCLLCRIQMTAWAQATSPTMIPIIRIDAAGLRDGRPQTRALSTAGCALFVLGTVILPSSLWRYYYRYSFGWNTDELAPDRDRRRRTVSWADITI